MKVLFATSEIYPYAKSGGLADVADALPNALSTHVEISRVMPLYGFMDDKKLKTYDHFTLNVFAESYEVEVLTQKKDGTLNYFVKAPLLSTTQNLYGDESGDYSNNDLRFGVFCMAIVELAKRLSIDVLHLNDWHTALAALFIKDLNLNIKTVFTIHNLAYQGVFDSKSLYNLRLDSKYFHKDALEFYGKVNFLKAGIVFSDALTTVSPTYAKEILTQDFGCGLEGLLAYHENKLSGILNGINAKVFNPSSDKNLEFNYSEKSLENKHKNKVSFIKKSTLKDPRKPLFVMVSRLVRQKGIDLVVDSLDEILSKKINLFIVGDGDSEISKKLSDASKEHDNFEFVEAYDETLSRQTFAAADFLLMPSAFEPCGLNQFIAMSYGAAPLVHAVGGLKDTVFENGVNCGRGIVYENQNKHELLQALERAIELKKNAKKFKELITSNMKCDFSFDSSALKYVEIYKNIL